MLKQLRLQHCYALKSLPDSIGKANNLKKLHLHGNKGLQVLPTSIGSLSNLELLGCTATSLQEIPISIGNLTNLRTLDFCRTLVERLPHSLGSLEKLEELWFHDNQSIRDFPENILRTLTNLRTLKAGNCNIQQLPDDLCNLSSLEVLNLSSNSALKSLPERLGDLRCLREVSFFGTSIKELPDSISLLLNLQTLDLGLCHQLKCLPDSIGKLTGLRTLRLLGTGKLQELPDTIGELRNLSRLDLSWSGIRSLPRSIGCLEKLLELQLGACIFLKDQLPSMRGLKDLKVLVLHGSGIMEISESKLPVQMVEAMRLRGSQEYKVFMSISHENNHINSLLSASSLTVRLREVGIASVVTSIDGEWRSKNESSRFQYISSCNILVVIFSERYVGSEDNLTELQMILESIIGNDQQQIIMVHDDIDPQTLLNLSRRDLRWREAMDDINRKVDTYVNSRFYSSSEVVEEFIVTDVMLRLEKMLGTPLNTQLTPPDDVVLDNLCGTTSSSSIKKRMIVVTDRTARPTRMRTHSTRLRDYVA